MKRRTLRVLTGVAVTALAVSTLQIPAQAANAPTDRDPAAAQAKKSDDLKSPLGEKQRALREEATQQLIKGTAKIETKGGQRVINVGKAEVRPVRRRARGVGLHDPVRLRHRGEVTGHRGHGRPAEQPDHGAGPRLGRQRHGRQLDLLDRGLQQGPLPGPDVRHGESFRDFYLKQSNGRFLAKGDVSDWVTVPFNEASYGSNAISDSKGAWPFIEDTATAWYNSQVALGKTPAEIKAYLVQFDKVDRYDYNHNGNFNEPDGYIDHFQAIHAGEGEEAGGGAQGADAIWSHRWYVNSNKAGTTGPSGNLAGGPDR